MNLIGLILWIIELTVNYLSDIDFLYIKKKSKTIQRK